MALPCDAPYTPASPVSAMDAGTTGRRLASHRRSVARPSEPGWGELALSAARGASGDATALARLVPALYPAVHTFLRGRLSTLADDDDLADMTQDAVLRAVARLPTVRARTDRELLAWVRAVAWRVALDALRAPWGHSSRVRLLSSDGRGVEAWHAAPEIAARDVAALAVAPDVDVDEAPTSPIAQLARLAAAAQVTLPPGSAFALWLRVMAGAPWEEVGAALSTTAAGAKRRVQRAQVLLRRRVWEGAAALPIGERHAALAQLRVLDPEGAAAWDHARSSRDV